MLPHFVPRSDSALLASVAGLLALALAGGCGKTVEDARETSTFNDSTDSDGAQADTVGDVSIPGETSDDKGSNSADGSTNSSAGASGGATSAGGSASGGAGAGASAATSIIIEQPCPDSLPEAGFSCYVSPSNICKFAADCCGDTREVTARCRSGRWHIEEAEPGACSYCAFEDGAVCELPAGCSSLTCYYTSCYDAQGIARCVDGRWSVQDECSK
jgi:hypothetical protein